jgi:hypothetical protein
MLTPSTIYHWKTIGPRMHWSGWQVTDTIEYRDGEGDNSGVPIGKQLECVFHWRDPKGRDHFVGVEVTEKDAPVREYLEMPWSDEWDHEAHEAVEKAKLGKYRKGLQRIKGWMENAA